MKKIVLSLVSILLIATSAAAFMRTADAAPGDPVISGTGRVGDTLTIASLGSLPGGPGDYTYTWLWEGEEVPGPMDYSASHTVTTADVGHEVSVLVKPKKGDGERLASNRVLASASMLTAPDVTVAGSPTVGRTLSAVVSGGTPGTTLTLQWLRDGVAVPGASAAAYRVVKGDAGRTLTVRATSSQTGKASVSRDAAVRRVAAFNAARPKIKGTAKIGKKLRLASRGTWYAPGHTFSYQWLRNGSKIARATKASYTVTRKDRGKRITLVVRARKSGFPTVSVSSSRTAKVR